MCQKLPTSAVLVFFLVKFLGKPCGFPRNGSRKKTKTANVSNFWHVFAIFRCLIGPLVVKLLHIIAEEVISIEMNGVTSKSGK